MYVHVLIKHHPSIGIDWAYNLKEVVKGDARDHPTMQEEQEGNLPETLEMCKCNGYPQNSKIVGSSRISHLQPLAAFNGFVEQVEGTCTQNHECLSFKNRSSCTIVVEHHESNEFRG